MKPSVTPGEYGLVMAPVGTVLSDGSLLTKEMHDAFMAHAMESGVVVITAEEHERRQEAKEREKEEERLAYEKMMKSLSAISHAGGAVNRHQKRAGAKKKASKKSLAAKNRSRGKSFGKRKRRKK